MLRLINKGETKQWQNPRGGTKTFYADCTIENNGQLVEKVSVWPMQDGGFPQGFFEGTPTEGEIVKNDKGYFTIKWAGNFSKKATWQTKENTINQVLDRKEASIEKSLDRKEASIILAAAQRDATILTSTFFGAEYKEIPFPTKDDWRREWKDNVKWLLKNRPTDEDLLDDKINRIVK